jgi:hypothetical protein
MDINIINFQIHKYFFEVSDTIHVFFLEEMVHVIQEIPIRHGAKTLQHGQMINSVSTL